MGRLTAKEQESVLLKGERDKLASKLEDTKEMIAFEKISIVGGRLWQRTTQSLALCELPPI